MAFRCKNQGCYETATWKCDGCDKIYCAIHQQIFQHKCTKCSYCKSRATDFCSECKEYVCSEIGCKIHMFVCDPSNKSQSSNFYQGKFNGSNLLTVSD